MLRRTLDVQYSYPANGTNTCSNTLGIPATLLPEVMTAPATFATTDADVLCGGDSVCGMAGDQASPRLIGHGLFSRPAMVKKTYGTGCSMVMNTGDTPIQLGASLLTTVATA